MARFPKMPLWTDALIGDTQHLTATQFGAYMLWLIVAWRDGDCSLPNDDGYLRRISRIEDHRGWPRLKAAVMPFWQLGGDGRLRQKRLSKERGFAEEVREKRVLAGARGGAAKKAHETRVSEHTSRDAYQGQAKSLGNHETALADGVAYGKLPRPDTKTLIESESKAAAVLPSSARAPAEVAAAAPSRFSGEGLHPEYADGIAVLERRLNLPATLAWKPLNDWLKGGASLELVLGAVTRVVTRQRGKDPDWQPRTLDYFADAVAKAKLAEAVVPVNGRRVAPWWTGGNHGTHPREAAKAGLEVKAHAALREWKDAHGFQLKMTRAPEVLATAAAEGIYLQTDED